LNPQLLEMLGHLHCGQVPDRHHHHPDELANERELAETAHKLDVDLIELAEHLENEDAAEEFFE